MEGKEDKKVTEKAIFEVLLEEAYEGDINSLIADLQDEYATKTYTELYEAYIKNPTLLKLWRKIFSDDVYRTIQDMFITIGKERG